MTLFNMKRGEAMEAGIEVGLSERNAERVFRS